MFRRLVPVLLLLASTLACNLWSKPASGWKGATGGEQIESLFWKDVQAKNWTEVDRHVAHNFAGAGPSGILDRDAFLRDLQQRPPATFSLADCNSRLNGADLMVTCGLRIQPAGQPTAISYSTLSVWQQLQKGWAMVAHSESLPSQGSN